MALCRKMTLVSWDLTLLLGFLILLIIVQSKEVDFKMALEAEANNAIAVSLLKTLSSEKESSENLFFSPWSISTALGMVAAGAKGKSLEELSNSFAWKSKQSIDLDLSLALARLSRNVVTQSQTSNQNILSLANKLWIDNNFAVLDAFKTSLQNNYQAEVGISDLSTRSEVARGEINNWVEEHTAHKIKDLFPQGSITAATRLVLANAVYFKGQWDNKFDKSDTRDEQFHLDGGKTVNVQMMYINAKFKTYSDDERGCEIIDMPYAGKHFSMLIALPHKLDGVNKLIENLTPQLVNAWFTSTTSRHEEMDVHIPKFKISDQMNLKETLVKIGVKDIFSETADLSGITGIQNLYVSSAMHKAFLEVNEEGTEASAATGIGINFMSMPPQFLVDHPFLFLIKHNPTGAIVFIGKITDPLKE